MAQPTIAIVSIGDMGLGVAKLLMANNYRVITNVADRSQATQDRAQNDSIETISNDLDLCNTADIIISIVPPRDALATAQRIAAVSQNAAFQHKTDINPLYYLDLNAISPDSARRIHSLFNDATSAILSIDGGIIGGPPHLTSEGTWYKPSIPTSGPHRLPYPSSPGTSEPSLAEVLNIKHIGPTIGTATGLKMCFAALTKGMTALALQSFTTAQNLGVLDELHKHLEMMAPAIGVRCRKGVVSMVPKAYRWVAEMDEIAATFHSDGGFAEDEAIFTSIARVYQSVADDVASSKQSESSSAEKDAATANAHQSSPPLPETVEKVVAMTAKGNETRRARAKSI